MAQGLGTSMLQVSNIIKNPWILLPATLSGAIIGPISTCVFKMTNIPVGAGMGTSGLVGQIGTFNSMGFSFDTLWKVLLLQIVLPEEGQHLPLLPRIVLSTHLSSVPPEAPQRCAASG